MQENRRVFLKKALGTAAVGVAAGITTSIAASPKVKDEGIVYGKSKKKEILYEATKNWELYYKRSY